MANGYIKAFTHLRGPKHQGLCVSSYSLSGYLAASGSTNSTGKGSLCLAALCQYREDVTAPSIPELNTAVINLLWICCLEVVEENITKASYPGRERCGYHSCSVFRLLECRNTTPSCKVSGELLLFSSAQLPAQLPGHFPSLPPSRMELTALRLSQAKARHNPSSILSRQ